MEFVTVENFEQWRDQARRFLNESVSPDQAHWTSDAQQPSLFGESAEVADHTAPKRSTKKVNVPQKFLDLARQVACHRNPQRWELLYRTLWRLTHGQRHLLTITTDDDVHELSRMQKAVTRDVHKMKAFVRFRKVVTSDPTGTIPSSEANSDHADTAAENYIAWHRPDHRIVRLAAPFFARRFKGMNWTILTPDESAVWDRSTLSYGPGVPVSEAPDADSLEDLWKTYYASIFNPARVKVAMMKSEMPVRHWPTLPETELIPELLREASSRVDTMVEQQEGFAKTGVHFMPDELTLPNLAKAVQSCTACDLCHDATQAVFGSGPADAKIVLIGEQPGDQEDLAGQPFVGPAGQLLDEVLQAIGLDRDSVYVTNTVKHFKHVRTGTRRLHKKPNSREIYACRPWLETEIAIVEPEVIVCLGATPAQALFGRDFRITQSRGRIIATDWCQQTIATWHPAVILRTPEGGKRIAMQQQLTEDLQRAASLA